MLQKMLVVGFWNKGYRWANQTAQKGTLRLTFTCYAGWRTHEQVGGRS